MTHHEIIQKLIGPIRPVGETETDNDRYDNLKAMCELTLKLVQEIDRVNYDFKDRSEYSIKRASDYAGNFINETLGIK